MHSAFCHHNCERNNIQGQCMYMIHSLQIIYINYLNNNKKKLQFEHIKKHTVHIWNVLDEIQLIRTLDSHGNRAKRL